MDQEEFSYDTDKAEALEDSKNPVIPENSMVNYVLNKFYRAETKKRSDEERFIRAYHNYRGLYSTDTKFTEAEKSRVFIKVTKTKVQAAYGQIVEVLFGNGKFPLTIDKTTLPEGIVDDVNFDPQQPAGATKAPLFGTNDGPPLPPGATQHNLGAAMEKKLEPVRDRLQPGPGGTPTSVTFSPADIAAKKMEKKIHDQLEECEASKHLRHAAFELATFGTGILKGPMLSTKEYPSWDEKGVYSPVMKTVPLLSYVSVWDAYPDPDGANMSSVEYFIERHKLSRSTLRALKNRPHFRALAIDRAIDYGPNYERKWWELEMEDGAGHPEVDRWEALEFWGFVPVEILEEHGVTIPEEMKEMGEINVNAWVCNGEVLRLVLNPFKPSRIPYYAAPYELNPYSFFGIGVSENMDDTQTLMNGFMRLAVDNAVLSGNLIFEVDENNLTPGQDLEMYPGKVIRRQGGAPGQALFATKFPNVSQENLMLFDKARQLADESTGFPSFAHGQTGVTGVGRTASGISMLMNAANGNIRTVIKNLDDYLLGPLGRAFFAFNMQFDFDPEIKGDLEVNARGTESLMATEVRSQRLMQFLQVVSSNPMLAPWAKMDVLVREIAKSLDLDPDRVTNSMPDAVIQAEILKAFQAPAAGAEGAPPAPGQPAAPGLGVGAGPGSGGGMMGTGGVPTPGEQGFSANTGQGQPQ